MELQQTVKKHLLNSRLSMHEIPSHGHSFTTDLANALRETNAAIAAIVEAL